MPRKKPNPQAGEKTAPTTELRTGEIIPPHGRGRLAPPWQKGQSGNPGGVGKVYHEARRICATAGPRAAEKLVHLMESDDDRVAFMAIEAVLVRGAGKPRDHSDEDARASRIDLTGLSSDERDSLAMLLKKALGL